MGRAVAFAAEIEPADGQGGRRAARRPVALDSSIGRGGLARALCRVVDLSTHGARLQTWSAQRADTMIWLTLPGIGHRVARIIWATDFEAGVEFHAPLSAEAFEALTA